MLHFRASISLIQFESLIVYRLIIHSIFDQWQLNSLFPVCQWNKELVIKNKQRLLVQKKQSTIVKNRPNFF